MTPLNTEQSDRISANPNASTPDSIQVAVRAFVFEQYPLCRQKNLLDTDSLIDSGIVDSMGILALVTFVESDFDITVQDTDLTPENFESIQAITQFITTHKTHNS